MSAQPNPIATMFEMQRNAVRQSQRAFEQTFDAQMQLSKAVLEGMKTGESARTSNLDVQKSAINAYFDALDASVPGETASFKELREAVLDQVDAANEVQDDAWEAMAQVVAENVEAYDEFASNYEAFVDDSVEAFLDAHAQLEEQAVSAAETLEREFEEQA